MPGGIMQKRSRLVATSFALVSLTAIAAAGSNLPFMDDIREFLGLDTSSSVVKTGDILAPTAVIAIQDFENPAGTPQWTIAAGAANISTATGAADTPATQRIRGGTQSWQVNNGTATLDLDPFT